MKVKQGKGVGISVETGEITNGAVTAVKLASDAVETAKIKDANVTVDKLATDSVSTAKIVNAAVTIDKVTQTGRAANLLLKANSDNTALEFGTASLSGDDLIVIGSQTHTVKEWLVAL